MIGKSEREEMLKAHSIGPRMISYLEEIGVETLAELRGADPHELAMRIDIALGRKHMNRLGVEALRNLVELAEREVVQVKPASSREARRALLDTVRASGAAKATTEPNAARSQDFLFDDDGLPN